MLTRIKAAALTVAIVAGAFVAPSAAQARSGLTVGMTMQSAEYSDHLSRYPGTRVVRVFSSSTPPTWSDSRITRLVSAGVIPFISSKTYDPAGFNRWLRAMPANIPMVYLAHFHEAEANMSASTYKYRQRRYWNVVQALPLSIRKRVKFGPIQTKQWTENNHRSYSEYDPGIGDFWGVDSYVNTWGLVYPPAATWLAQIRAYNTGARPKWIPELGVISMPSDPTDQGRAAWINSVASILEADTKFGLVMWWCTMGTAGSSVPGVGKVRNFHLDQRYTTSGGTVTVTPSATAWRAFTARNTP